MTPLGHLIENVPGRAAIFAVAALGALFLALPLSLWLARPSADLGPYERMGMEIGCVCGTCPFRPILTCGCGFADQMLDDLRAAVDSSLDDEQIMATFVADYGPAVRIKPDTSGLDLTSWLAPMVLLLVGGVVVAAVLSRWQRQADLDVEHPRGDTDAGRAEDIVAGVASATRSSEDQRYLDVVEREIEGLVDRGIDSGEK